MQIRKFTKDNCSRNNDSKKMVSELLENTLICAIIKYHKDISMNILRNSVTGTASYTKSV